MGEVIDIVDRLEARQAVELWEKSDKLHSDVLQLWSEQFAKQVDREMMKGLELK